MEDPNPSADSASDPSGAHVEPPKESLPLNKLRRSFELLEKAARPPSRGSGLPVVDHPEIVLGDEFSAEEIAAILAHLIARRCILIDRLYSEEGERILIIGNTPEVGDKIFPPRVFEFTSELDEPQKEAGPDQGSTTCLIPNLLAGVSGEGVEDWDDVAISEDGELQLAVRKGLSDSTEALNARYRAVAKAVLKNIPIPIANIPGGPVHDPLEKMRDTLRKMGVTPAEEGAFINWMVHHDLIFIEVVGPKVISLRKNAFPSSERKNTVQPGDEESAREALDLDLEDFPEKLVLAAHRTGWHGRRGTFSLRMY